jgi:hypothetical protein
MGATPCSALPSKRCLPARAATIKIMIALACHAHLEESPGGLNVSQVRIRYCNSLWQRRALRTATGREPLEPAPSCRRSRLCVNRRSSRSGFAGSRFSRVAPNHDSYDGDRYWNGDNCFPDRTRWLQLINAGQQLCQRFEASSDIGQLPESTKLQRQGAPSHLTSAGGPSSATSGPFVTHPRRGP